MHADFIDQLGGSRAMAKALGIKNADAVSNWRSRGVPWAWRPTVAALARAKKISLPAGFLAPPSVESETPSPSPEAA